MKWVTLPPAWDLGNVRAISTLLISISCVVGIWVLGFARWKYHADKINKQASAGLFGLLGVSGIGEAFDATVAVYTTGQPAKYWELLLHCAAVVVLAVIGMLAGPTARYAIRTGFVIEQTALQGSLATTNSTNIKAAMVKWKSTISRLDAAGFPREELLDFLPDVTVDWQYKASEWNSSWTMSCNYINRTNIPVLGTDDGSSNEPANLLDEIAGVRSVYPPDLGPRRESIARGGWLRGDLFKDLIVYVLLSARPPGMLADVDPYQGNNETLRLVFMAIHLRNIPSSHTRERKADGPLTGVRGGKGNVENAGDSAGLDETQSSVYSDYVRTPDVGATRP